MSGLLDHPLIAARYFFPGGRAPASRVNVPVEDALLACARHEVDPAWPTLVFFHGNGEVVADWQGTLDRIVLPLGWNLFLAEYRGYGGSTGTPLLGRLLDDVAAVIEAAGPPERLVVMGRSVGSLFAVEAVRRFPRLAGLVLESGIADPVERIMLRVTPAELGATQAQWTALERRLDHEPAMAGYSGPVLLLHTRHDGLVDVSHARRLRAWAGGPATLRVFDHGDHNSILFANAEEYAGELARFLGDFFVD